MKRENLLISARTIFTGAETRVGKCLLLGCLDQLSKLGKTCAIVNVDRNPGASQPPSNACQIGDRVMQGKVKEEWMQMCEQAAVEQDSEKLMALVMEINRMLDEKDQRLKTGNPAPAPNLSDSSRGRL